MDQTEKARFKIEDFLGYNNNHAVPAEDLPSIDWGNVQAEYEAAQKKKWAKFPKLIKDFYEEHPEVTAMPDCQVEKFREENNNIVVTNFDEKSKAPILKPVTTFEQAFCRYPDIMATINKQVSIFRQKAWLFYCKTRHSRL